MISRNFMAWMLSDATVLRKTVCKRAMTTDGQRLQKLFIGEQPVQPERVYRASFVTEQGVPMKYGRNRQKQAQQAVDALCRYVKRHTPLRVNLLGTFVLV